MKHFTHNINHVSHDSYVSLQMMNVHIHSLKEMVKKRNISFSDAEYSIEYLGRAIRHMKSHLDVNIMIDNIKKSRFNICASRIPIDLLRRFKQITEELNRNGVVWYICSDNSELSTKIIYAEKYYLTAINCILENAIEYASPSSIICINMCGDKIEISNVGIPIHEDEINRIYDYEFRGKEAIKSNPYGLGFGLYIAKNVFDAYNSTISINSESFVENSNEVESLIYSLLKSFNKEHLSEYLTEFQYEAAKKTIGEIGQIYNKNHEIECLYINKTSVKNWLNYWANSMNSENINYIDFILNKPKAKVTVTIIYGKEKENTIN